MKTYIQPCVETHYLVMTSIRMSTTPETQPPAGEGGDSEAPGRRLYR